MAAKKQNRYEHLWPKKKETRLVQAQIDVNLHALIKAELDKKGLTWHEYIEGLMTQYALDEKLK